MTPELIEKLLDIIEDYDRGRKTRADVVAAIAKVVIKELPRKAEPEKGLCECEYLQCQCGGWNACLEETKRIWE